jgi:hypothetical protein
MLFCRGVNSFLTYLADLVDCFSHLITILRRTSVYFQWKGLADLA